MYRDDYERREKHVNVLVNKTRKCNTRLDLTHVKLDDGVFQAYFFEIKLIQNIIIGEFYMPSKNERYKGIINRIKKDNKDVIVGNGQNLYLVGKDRLKDLEVLVPTYSTSDDFPYLSFSFMKYYDDAKTLNANSFITKCIRFDN